MLTSTKKLMFMLLIPLSTAEHCTVMTKEATSKVTSNQVGSGGTKNGSNLKVLQSSMEGKVFPRNKAPLIVTRPAPTLPAIPKTIVTVPKHNVKSIKPVNQRLSYKAQPDIVADRGASNGCNKCNNRGNNVITDVAYEDKPKNHDAPIETAEKPGFIARFINRWFRPKENQRKLKKNSDEDNLYEQIANGIAPRAKDR